MGLFSIFKLKTPRVRDKKCCLCGKRIRHYNYHTQYCPRCSEFVYRIDRKQLPRKTVKKLLDYVRQNGFRCYYTGMLLDMINPHSPWYCVFDHWMPHDNRKVVITSSLINDMKSDLTEDEFWTMIRQLANYWRTHTKVRKIRLRHWSRNYNRPTLVTQLLMRSFSTRTKCQVCGKRILHVRYNSKYCRVCAKYVNDMKKRGLPTKTIKEVCAYIRKHGYRCYYTGMLLEVNDFLSPWYCVLDHWIPGDPRKVVLTSAVLNAMKSDLTEKEFRYYVLALADYKEKHKKVRKRKLICWQRLVPLVKTVG